MKRLSRADLEAVLDFAGEVVVAARAAERQDEWLLAQIARLIEAEMLRYARVDDSYRSHDVTVLGDSAEPPASGEVLAALRSKENPYNEYAERTRQPHFSATRLFDIVDRKTFQRTNLYKFIPFPDAPSVQMRMPGRGGSRWQLDVLHPGGEFTDRQLALLDAARPWLELYEDRRALARQVAVERAASVDRRAVVPLSEREHQVLDRLAEGASNQDIAHALHISLGTVRKHLENIYTKLEVTSRTAALARSGRTTITNEDWRSWDGRD